MTAIARTVRRLSALPEVAAARDAFHTWQDANDAASRIFRSRAPREDFDAAVQAAKKAEAELHSHLHSVLLQIDLGAGHALTGAPDARAESAFRRAKAAGS